MKPEKLAQAAKKAAHIIAHTPTEQKDKALLALGQLIGEKKAYLLLENKKDVEAAQKAGLAGSLKSRGPCRRNSQGLEETERVASRPHENSHRGDLCYL